MLSFLFLSFISFPLIRVLLKGVFYPFFGRFSSLLTPSSSSSSSPPSPSVSRSSSRSPPFPPSPSPRALSNVERLFVGGLESREREQAIAGFLEFSAHKVPRVDSVLERLHAMVTKHPVLQSTLVSENSRLYTRLQKLCGVKFNGFARKKDFAVANHFQVEHVASGDQIKTRLQILLARPLPKDKPLWTSTLIINDGEESLEEKRVAGVFFIKVHHSIADGHSGLQLFSCLAEEIPSNAPVKDHTSKPTYHSVAANTKQGSRKRLNLFSALIDSIIYWLQIIVSKGVSFKHFCTTHESKGEIPTPSSSPSEPRSLSSGESLPPGKRIAFLNLNLDQVKAIKTRYNCSVNDVLVSSVVGGFRRHALSLGMKVGATPEPFSMIPVSTRRCVADFLEVGNKVSGLFLRLPLQTPSPIQRLLQTQKRMLALKERPALLYESFACLQLFGFLPPFVSRLFLQPVYKKALCVMTNLMGPVNPLKMGNAPIRELKALGIQSPSDGLGISFCSYCGKVQMGIVADDNGAFVSDLNTFLEMVNQEFVELYQGI